MVVVLVDRFEQPLQVCADPSCRWAGLPQHRHFDLHNPPCGAYFVGTDGTELLCELLAGHDGPHRGAPRRP